MRNSIVRILSVLLLLLIATVSGVYATWQFAEETPQEQSDSFNVMLNEFTFAPKETLHITEVSLYTMSGVSNVSASFSHPTYLSSTVDASRSNCSVTYKVTLYNNTGVTYWYLGPSWGSAASGNALIGATNGITITTMDNYGDSGNTFNTEDWVPPYTTRDIYVTFKFGSNAVGAGVSLAISLDFGMKMDAVHDGFLAILNDATSGTGYQYLDEVFDQRYKETGKTVIANVGEDAEIFTTLFGGTPTIKIDGNDVPVTIMIERANVDGLSTGDSYGVSGGPTGCEYTLYITVDPLDSPTGEALVYAVSYSRGGVGGTGEWYQLGQLYEGKAPLTTYYNDTDEVVFNIDEWKATPNDYEFIDGYYYKVGYDQGDQYAKYKTIEELMSCNDQNYYNDINNSGLLRKVWEVVVKNKNSNASKPGYEGLKAAFEHAAPFYNVNNGPDIQIKREAKRAELIPYIVAIQKAYTYYLQVNP